MKIILVDPNLVRTFFGNNFFEPVVLPGKFLPDHSKVSKLGIWWDPFIQSRKCMSLTFTET